MEVKNKISVRKMVTDNRELLLKMDLIGLKNISTAIDYLSILEEYERHDWIESISDRKRVVADRLKVSVSSVEKALYLMKQVI